MENNVSLFVETWVCVGKLGCLRMGIHYMNRHSPAQIDQYT